MPGGLDRSALNAYLVARADRCSHGWANTHQTCPDCGTDWDRFKAALVASVRSDQSIHQCDMRSKIRGHIEPKSIGTLYRRAKAEGLIADTGEREPSNDVAGRNADKLDRVYRFLGGASEWSAA